MNENVFSFTVLCKVSQVLMMAIDGQLKQHIYYSFTLLISYMFFNSFKNGGLVLLECIKFSQF